MEFALATAVPVKSRMNGALTSQTPMARFSHSAGGQVVAGHALEMRAQGKHQADDDGVRGGRVVLGMAGDPRRHGKPEPEREARPVLPFCRHPALLDARPMGTTRLDHRGIAPVLIGA
jgi:hypothetical protein